MLKRGDMTAVLDNLSDLIEVESTPCSDEQVGRIPCSMHTNRGDITKDVVLVSAGELKTLRQAYPNYFLDINEFTSRLSAIIDILDEKKVIWKYESSTIQKED